MTIYYSLTTNGFYDSELGYRSYPDDIIEITSAQYNSFLDGINRLGKEVYLNESNQLTLRAKVIVVTWDDIRGKRDKLLSQSDYTQVADWPGDKEAWATYRSALRDITTTFSDPASVVWPTPPGA
jgi:hypothetical protein